MRLSAKVRAPEKSTNAFQTIEEYSASIKGLNLHGRQLSKGDFNGYSEIINTQGFKLGIRKAEVKHVQTASIGTDFVGMVFPLKQLEYIFNGKYHRHDSQMLGYDAETCVIFPKDHIHLTLQISTAELHKYFSDDEVNLFHHACENMYGCNVCAEKKQRFTSYLHKFHRSLIELTEQSYNPIAYKDCYDSLFYTTYEYLKLHADEPKGRVTNKERLLLRVLEYIHGEDVQDLSLSSLVSGTHASSRAIQYCFSDLLGMSPKNYLVKLRLNAIRKEFVDADPAVTTITGIANKYGVINIGRFKQDYERFFNETPRETINLSK